MRSFSLHEHIQRIEQEWTDINSRIARLSLLLRIPLNEEQNVRAVLEKDHGILSVRFPHPPGAAKTYRERHRARALEELRGLMVLRYKFLKSSLQKQGLALTRQIVLDAKAQTERRGFKPGMDSFDLLDAFGPPPPPPNEENQPMGW